MDNLRLESDGDSRLESGAVREEDEEEAVDPNDIRLASEDNRLKSGVVREEVSELELEEKKTNARIQEEEQRKKKQRGTESY